jgi:hypothetical protein
MASVSVNVPCVAHVFSMMTLPSRSTICALISPVCPLISESSDCSPERMRARVSRTHVGHRESVVRGQPNCGLVRCVLFSSGAGAQLGWKVGDSNCRLIS